MSGKSTLIGRVENGRLLKRILQSPAAVTLCFFLLAGCSQKPAVERVDSLYEQANAAFREKRFEEAERLALKSATIAKESLPAHIGRIAEAFQLAGQSAAVLRDDDRAFKHFQSAIAVLDKDRHPLEWSRLWFAVSFIHVNRGHYAEAEPILRQVIVSFREHLGTEDSETIQARAEFGNALYAQGKYVEAETELRAVLTISERVHGAQSVEAAGARMHLARVLTAQQRYVEAKGESQSAFAAFERFYGPTNGATVNARLVLADALEGQENFQAAEKHLRELLALRQSVRDTEYRGWAMLSYRLAVCLKKQGKRAEARSLAQQAVEEIRRTYGPTHPFTEDANRLVRELWLE